MLLCPVRGCHKPLLLADRQRRCEAGHSFDLARSGYTNLLQPQERRSKRPGDTAQAVGARRRLHEGGFTQALLNAMGEMARPQPTDQALDAGCGDGFYLGNLAAQTRFAGHGIDISIPAVDAAARKYPDCEWIVGNADRFIPYSDGAFSLVLSITARMNPSEFHRVLRSDGRLLVAVPGPDDLKELRGEGRDRVPRTVADFGPFFCVSDQRRATTTVNLSPDAVMDVLLSTYRPGSKSSPDAPGPARQVTFSLDLLLFRPK